jgi:hypothetical protein
MTSAFLCPPLLHIDPKTTMRKLYCVFSKNDGGISMFTSLRSKNVPVALTILVLW